MKLSQIQTKVTQRLTMKYKKEIQGKNVN